MAGYRIPQKYLSRAPQRPSRYGYEGSAADPWDASDEPDAFSPLAMIQPGAEDVSGDDNAELDAWLGRTATPPSTVDASRIRPLDEVDASGIAPLADMEFSLDEVDAANDAPDMTFTENEVYGERPADMTFTENEVYGERPADMTFTLDETEPQPQGQPQRAAMPGEKAPIAASQMTRTVEDDGEGTARAESEAAYNKNRVARIVAALLSGGNQQIDQNLAEQQRYYSEAPLKAFERSQAAKAQRGAQEMRITQQQAAAIEQARRFDAQQRLREEAADPDSARNARQRELEGSEWSRRQAEELKNRLEFERLTADERRRRAALVGGQRDPEAPRPMRSGGSGDPVANAADAQAEAMLGMFRTDGVQPPEYAVAMVDQLRNTSLSDTDRRELRTTIREAAQDWQVENREAAQDYGKALNTYGITKQRNAINEARRMIERNRRPDGSIEGVDWTRAIAGTPLTALFDASTPRGRELQNALTRAQNVHLRDDTGAAAPESEKAQYAQIWANQAWSSADDLMRALDQAERIADEYEQTTIQTFSPRGAEVYYARAPRARALVQSEGANATTQPGRPTPTDSPGERTVASRKRNPRTGQILTIYTDGSREVTNGP